MITFAGLLFLTGGLGAFLVCILGAAAYQKILRRPKQTVEHFQQTRYALHRIHRTQTALRSSARARARAMHPAGRRSRGRRSA
jgi:hypothetical protein